MTSLQQQLGALNIPSTVPRPLASLKTIQTSFLPYDVSVFGMPHLSHTSLLHPLPLVSPSLLSLLHQDLSCRSISSLDSSDFSSSLQQLDERKELSPSTHVTSSTSESDVSPGRTLVIVRNEQKRKKELVKDDAYWERRRKNNDAAKRSRDSRRQKEDEMAVRAALLEQENIRLKLELSQLRSEGDRLRLLMLGTPVDLLPLQPSVVVQNPACQPAPTPPSASPPPRASSSSASSSSS